MLRAEIIDILGIVNADVTDIIIDIADVADIIIDIANIIIDIAVETGKCV